MSDKKAPPVERKFVKELCKGDRIILHGPKEVLSNNPHPGYPERYRKVEYCDVMGKPGIGEWANHETIDVYGKNEG